MSNKTKAKDQDRDVATDVTQIAGDEISIKKAAEWWNRRYPEAVVTEQTLRNWAKKYNFGKKKNFLPRSKWIVDKNAFISFLTNIENTCEK